MAIPPPAIVWTLGAIAAAVVGKLLVKEWRRANDELDRVRRATVATGDRERLPKLRRDPSTGVYRPHR